MQLGESALRLLSKRRGRSLEATESLGGNGGAVVESVAPEVTAPSDDDLETSFQALKGRLAQFSGGFAKLDDADHAVLAKARGAVDTLKRSRREAILDQSQVAATEAIAIADGSRPAIRCRADALLVDDVPQDCVWRQDLGPWSGAISALLPSVGRVDADGGHVGTGWVIREGYIVTNRHVAQALSINPGDEILHLATHRVTTIDFARETRDQISRRCFKIERIVFNGREWIDPNRINHAKLDLAVMKISPLDGAVEPLALADAAWPTPQPDGQAIVALGFPGTTAFSQLPSTTLSKLFQNDLGVKRVSPGYVSAGLGSQAGDVAARVFLHDATTLGGSSGSLIITLNKDARWGVVGLHYGGYEERWGPEGAEKHGGNFGHSFEAMPDVVSLVDAAIVADRAIG